MEERLLELLPHVRRARRTALDSLGPLAARGPSTGPATGRCSSELGPIDGDDRRRAPGRRLWPRGRLRARPVLAAAGIVVVSGLAMGIDSAAHEGGAGRGRARPSRFSGPAPSAPYPRSAGGLYPAGPRRRRRDLRAAARLADVPLDVPGPQPPDGGAGRDHRRRRGGGALGLADHRRDGDRLWHARSVPCPGRSTRGDRAARTGCSPTARRSIRDARDVLDLLLGPGVGSAAARSARRWAPEPDGARMRSRAARRPPTRSPPRFRARALRALLAALARPRA